ncbi:thioredoxin domain-containing protein [Exiguobacterium sp. TNDT2]|uniref:thioredoxin domain-containing protein n=1 Tax=Exiguobacterium sp. TNDT2 TaxID=2233531 RepID=UPI000DEF3605|nr:thioredoxin domain-containing protein [Exiguobacterium sp. TNDT2]
MKRCYLLLVGLIFVLAACDRSEAVDATKLHTYTKYELPLEDKVALGEGEHEIVFVFDYSCPWCKKWMEEVLPEIEERWLETGDATFKGQPLVLLNEQSQLLANVDYNVERLIPDRYYEVQRAIGLDSGSDGFGTETYARELAAQFNLNVDELLEGHVDIGIQNSRLFTRDFGVAYVPTVYVDGIRLVDAFSLEEMAHIMEGTIKAGDTVKLPQQ